MIFDLSKARIFLRPGCTDLRKAVNGLSIIVQEEIAVQWGCIFILQPGTEVIEGCVLGQDRFLVKPEAA